MSVLDQFRLDGQVALITGGGRGLGQAIADAYAAVGAETVIVGRTESELRSTARLIERHGHRCIPIVADITRPQEPAQVLQPALDRCNQVDILVNGATFTLDGGGYLPRALEAAP
ncbi:MAG: 7-alpha-hydroxysteroid dehydrogenase [Chloroflexi bacterium]|nr:MAG: 7-alpha-hydroxysteroid dehydrogenase [Chloroflexota bacterium]